MNCLECQSALSPFDASCPRCAQMQTARSATAVTSVPRPAPIYHAAPETSACVACGSPTVQKVSGLYRGGVWSAEAVGGGGGYGRTSGGQSFTTVSTSHAVSAGGTSLAQALAPPNPPRYTQTTAETLMICSCILATILWIVGYVGIFSDSGSAPKLVNNFRIIAILFTVGAVTTIPFALASARTRRGELHLLTGQWQRVITLWDRPYYGSRCDRVFNPQTGQHAPSHAASSILYGDILNGTNSL